MEAAKTIDHTAIAAEHPFRNRNFLILLVTGILLTVGAKVYELTLPLLLYDLTRSSAAMSGMRAAEFLPNMLLAVFIGVLVDRWPRKPLTLWVVGLQAALLLILFAWLSHANVPLFAFYTFGFILMTLNYTYGNARVSMVKGVLPGTMLTQANASFTFVSTFVGIMGPAIAGGILMLSRLEEGLLITAGAMAAAWVSLLFLGDVAKPKPKGTRFAADLKEGWAALRSNKAMWWITMMVIFTNSTAGMVDAVVVFFAKDGLKLTNGEVGLVLSCGGIGGLIGSMLVSRMRRLLPFGKLLGYSRLAAVFSCAVMSLPAGPFGLGAGLFLDGLCGVIGSVLIWTYRQESTPSELIGRVSGITGSIFKLGMPLAMVLAGIAAGIMDTQYVFAAASVLNALIFLVYRRSFLWRLA